MSRPIHCVGRSARRTAQIPSPRTFSTSAIHHAQRQPSRPTPAAQKAEQVGSREGRKAKKNQLTDIGVLEGTYIKPYHSELLPSWGNLKERLPIEWLQLKRRFLGLLTLAVYGYKTRKADYRKTGLLEVLPLSPRSPLIPLAKDLRTRLDTALSKGNLQVLERMTTGSFYKTLQKIVLARPKGHTIKSTLEFTKSPRVISERGGLVNEDEKSPTGIRQAVVRLHTRQSVERTTEKGEIVNTVPEKEHVEFMVIQQMLIDGRAESWTIQGFAEEQTPEMYEAAQLDLMRRQDGIRAWQKQTGRA